MPATPALPSRWQDEIRYRPLVWMALAAVLGVALGGQWALWLSHGVLAKLSRSDGRLLWPLLLAALAAAGWLKFAPRISYSGVTVLLLVGFFAAYTGWRLVPPPGDISARTITPPNRAGPLVAPTLGLRGVVADFPRRGDFNVQFPLQCSAPQAGVLWVRAPYDCPAQIGDEVSMLAELRPLPCPTNPGQRQMFWFSILSNCWAGAIKVKNLRVERVAAPGSLTKRVAGARNAILNRYTSLFKAGGLAAQPFPSATAQLLTAMVFGEGGLSSPLPRRVRDDFRGAGMSHLLVASGSQCAFLLGGLLWLRRSLRFRALWLLIVLVPALLLYVLVVGGSPSIWRATLLGLLAVLALLHGRRSDALSLWCATLLLLLTFDPACAWSLSLQLTFAATWGLICLSPAIKRVLEPLGEGKLYQIAISTLALTAGAQLATLPLAIFHFGTLSTAGLAANFVALPLAAVLLFCGSLGLVFSTLSSLNYFLTREMGWLAQSAAELPGAQWHNLSFSPGATFGCYGLLLLVTVAMSLWPLDPQQRDEWLQWVRQKVAAGRAFLLDLRPLPVGGAVIFCALLLVVWSYWPRPDVVRLVMLDVGQGESLLIVTPHGHAFLIDGGSSDERAEVGQGIILPALQSFGVSRLDAVFLTHADSDHCNALPTVFQEIPVGAFVDGVQASNEDETGAADYQATLREAARQKVPVVVPRAGMAWNIDGASLRVLGSTTPYLGSENDNALAMRLEFGATSVLFTGDLEGAGEERLVQRGFASPATILKVSHHGSGGSSTPDFLSHVRPQAALISCGRFNHYGHPATPTLKRLQGIGAQVFRTDVDGALQATCDRSSCRVEALTR